MQKARRYNTQLLRPLVGEWFQGLFHSSVRGSFHLSFTVLVHYRSLGSIQPYGMVPADSYRISRVPYYSGFYLVNAESRIRDFHPLWSIFPNCSTSLCYTVLQSFNPSYALLHNWFGLFRVRSPLLAESLLFSFPMGTQMFQFPTFAH